MKQTFLVCIIFFITGFITAITSGDVFRPAKVAVIKSGLGANDLGETAWDGSTLWASGSGTLNNLVPVVGNGDNFLDWISYRQMDGFGHGSVSALYASGNTLITAWVYNDERADAIYLTGDGISISTDHGKSWKHVTILDLFPERSIWSYPGTYTVTYDFSFSGENLWCSATSGFLLKTNDLGDTWTQVLPNTDEFNFNDLNHHGYCVDAYGDTLWVGTFQGINVSFNAGETWTNFSWPLDGSGSLQDQWPGNWVYAVEHKVAGGKTHVWVASQRETANTGGLGIDGICHTDDNGATWEYKTTDYIAWNFAFGHDGASDPKVGDETVLAATDSGLVISYDLGENWEIINIRESEQKAWERGHRVSAILVVADTLWATSSDGIARSNDWGKTWQIFKGVTRVRALDTGDRNVGISSEFDNVDTFAYPNPFSPSRNDQNYSRTKIQYSLTNNANITVSIYNYHGRLIKELVSGLFRKGGEVHDEIWDGRDSDGRIVPNGVYFFVIKTGQGDSARGKIMVLD